MDGTKHATIKVSRARAGYHLHRYGIPDDHHRVTIVAVVRERIPWARILYDDGSEDIIVVKPHPEGTRPKRP